MTKFSTANFQQKKLRPSVIILTIQRPVGKQRRSGSGGLQATSSRTTLFANSAICVSDTKRVHNCNYMYPKFGSEYLAT